MATMTDPAPKGRDPERSRAAILDAAEALFADRGYHPTSMAEIGERAGVSRGTPGYFFGTKDALYRAVLERCFADALDAVRVGRLRAERSGREQEAVLAGIVADYTDFAAAHPNFVRLMHREALGDGPDPSPSASGLAVGAEAVAALAQELQLPAASDQVAQQLALSLLSLSWFPVLHRQTMVPSVGLDPEDPAFLDCRKEHITALLRAALPAPRPPSRWSTR
jgi:AcrR family transcriptional regulator